MRGDRVRLTYFNYSIQYFIYVYNTQICVHSARNIILYLRGLTRILQFVRTTFAAWKEKGFGEGGVGVAVADAARSLSYGIFGEPSRTVQVACVLRLVLKPDFRKLRHVKSQLAYSKIMLVCVCVCVCRCVHVYVDFRFAYFSAHARSPD